MQCIKCVIVGDNSVGKSSLLYSMVNSPIDSKFLEHIPPITTEWNLEHKIEYDGSKVNIGFWDTMGDQAYDRLRPLSYPRTDVFILAFSFDSRESFNNIKSKWQLEVNHHSPNSPIVLVGMKSDLKAKVNDCISDQQIQEMMNDITGAKYIECSSLTQHGVKELVVDLVRVVMKPRDRERNRGCRVM